MDIYVKDFGALPGTQKVQTSAIQAAIDACEESGGGTVFFETGTYITGTIYLRSNTYLNLPYMCVLKGSDSFADYNKPDAWPQNTPIPIEHANGMHLIVGLEIENSGIFKGKKKKAEDEDAEQNESADNKFIEKLLSDLPETTCLAFLCSFLILFTMLLIISALSIPVCPKTPGEIAARQPKPASSYKMMSILLM